MRQHATGLLTGDNDSPESNVMLHQPSPDLNSSHSVDLAMAAVIAGCLVHEGVIPLDTSNPLTFENYEVAIKTIARALAALYPHVSEQMRGLPF